MANPFKAVKIAEQVYWVGAIDWAIRDFHGYLTHRGTTYNAYLILADKVTLIDTVKAPFYFELLSRVRSVIDPREIAYIVSHHAEMDHSGCLPDLIREANPEKIFASSIGVKTLSQHFPAGWELTPVKDGESISLGNLSLTFLETRMLHWPDSMMSYLEGRKILFSQDGFGMHLASTERFADEIAEEILYWEGAKYFANILNLYSPLITKLLKRVKELGLPINVIAPDHGPIWRREVDRIIDWYAGWANPRPVEKAVVVYDSMWLSTEKMARAIAAGIASQGIQVKVFSLKSHHRSEVVTELLDAAALIVGSPTLNNNIYPSIADFLVYLRGLKFRHLLGGAFGSYGWSGEAVEQIESILKDTGIKILEKGIRTQYVPDNSVLTDCFEFGRKVAEGVRELCGKGEKADEEIRM